MNSSTSKKPISKNTAQISTCPQLPMFERSLYSQLICSFILNDILSTSESILSRRAYLNELIGQQKIKQSQKFTINNCGEVLQTFFAEHQCLSPKMVHEQDIKSPSKSPYSFLDYEEIITQTERGPISQAKQQQWERRRDSTKIYNCNKLYIVKKNRQRKDSIDHNSTDKSIDFNQLDSISGRFSARHSHKTEIKKISIIHNVFVPRLSGQGRLTANHFTASMQGLPQTAFLKVDNSPKQRSSFFQQKISSKEIFNNSKLIKLDFNKKDPSEKSFKFKQSQNETNNYISYLRERKQKLQIIMKDFDIDEMAKKNQKLQRQNLMRDSKTQNLASTYRKTPSITTDYDGKPLLIFQPKSMNQPGLQKNLKLQVKTPRYEPNEQGTMNDNVSFKLKDIDDKTKSFINQIFSSARGTPSKTTKKLTFNANNADFNRTKQKQSTNLSSKISLNFEEKNDLDRKNSFDSSIRVLQSPRHKKNLKTNTDRLKERKSIILPQANTEEKQNHILNQITPLNTNKVELKIIKCRETFKSQPANRENKKPEESLFQLQRIHRQGYALKKQRIHPNLSKTKKSFNLNAEMYEKNVIQQADNQNSDKNILLSNQNQPLESFFDKFLRKTLK